MSSYQYETLFAFNNLKQYTPAIFIEDINTWQDELKNINFNVTKTTKIGLTAGASTQKEELVELKNLIIKTLEEQE